MTEDQCSPATTWRASFERRASSMRGGRGCLLYYLPASAEMARDDRLTTAVASWKAADDGFQRRHENARG